MNAQPVDVGLRSRSRLDGLLFGLLSGLAFALVTWGWDAVSLARVASYCPWFKFVVGTVFCLIVGGAVGWVVAALDRSLVGLVGWALAGLAFGWLAAYLPFQGFNRLIGWLNPRFEGIVIYPVVELAHARSTVNSVLVAATIGLGGLLEIMALDHAQSSVSRISRGLALASCIPFMITAGGLANANNRQLREPQENVVALIRLAMTAREVGISREEALEMHLGAFNPVQEMLSEPRRVMVGSYDPSIVSVGVEIEVDRGWIRCILVAGQATYCQPTDPIYVDGFTCLLAGHDAEGETCDIEMTPESQRWIEARRRQIGERPQVEVTAQMGSVVLLDGVGADGEAFECRFFGSLPVILEACQPPVLAGGAGG